MKDNKINILIAGTGFLGKEIIKILDGRNFILNALAYKKEEFAGIEDKLQQTYCVDVTKPETLKGIFTDVDIVFSTIGITRIRSNMTHMSVDYQGNINLLREAEKSKVKKFIFISPQSVDEGHDYVPLFKAKYLFEQELMKSKINWIIFRSGGFYSDLAKMGEFAEKNSMILIGSGNAKSTPVDVIDLANIMVEDSFNKHNEIIEVGGPEIHSWNEISNICFSVLNKKPKILHVPLWICKLTALLLKPFSPSNFGMARLLIYSAEKDLITKTRGKKLFKNYFEEYLKARKT